MIQIGHQRYGAGRAQLVAPRGMAGDRENAEALAQQRQQAHADVATAEDQQARLADFFDVIFHYRIV